MKKHIFALLLGAAMLSACTETVNTFGQVILPSRLAQVQVGTTTKDEVQQLLGSPSAQGTMNNNRWYYITSTEVSKPLNPHILKSRRIVIIDFDAATGVVAAMEEKTEADGKTVDPARKTTKTEGQSMGLVEQLMGNIGMGGN